MIQWDLKIVMQKEIRREYLEFVLLQLIELNPVVSFWGQRKLSMEILPPSEFRKTAGPLPLDSTADLFNYIRKTHTLKEPVLNLKRISCLAESTESLRNRLIIALLTGTSLTIKKLVSLRASDLLPEKRVLMIPSDEGSVSSRFILLSQRTTQLFLQLVQHKEMGMPLFSTREGRPLKMATVQAIYSRTLKKTGL